MRIQEFKAEIIDIKEYYLNNKLHARHFTVKVPENIDFSFKAGQFVMLASPKLKLWGNPNELKWGAFSIASSPFDLPFLEFIVRIKEVPGLTNHLGFKTKKGDYLMIKGPYGEFTLRVEDKKRMFIATGTGIAPMISYLRTMKNTEFKDSVLLYGTFCDNTCFSFKELLNLKLEYDNFNFEVIYSDCFKKGMKKGFVQDLIKENAFTENKKDVGCYICGNPIMLKEVVSLLKTLGFSRIYTEKY